jgi:hypothetical protein
MRKRHLVRVPRPVGRSHGSRDQFRVFQNRLHGIGRLRLDHQSRQNAGAPAALP